MKEAFEKKKYDIYIYIYMIYIYIYIYDIISYRIYHMILVTFQYDITYILHTFFNIDTTTLKIFIIYSKI